MGGRIPKPPAIFSGKCNKEKCLQPAQAPGLRSSGLLRSPWLSFSLSELSERPGTRDAIPRMQISSSPTILHLPLRASSLRLKSRSCQARPRVRVLSASLFTSCRAHCHTSAWPVTCREALIELSPHISPLKLPREEGGGLASVRPCLPVLPDLVAATAVLGEARQSHGQSPLTVRLCSAAVTIASCLAGSKARFGSASPLPARVSGALGTELREASAGLPGL